LKLKNAFASAVIVLVGVSLAGCDKPAAPRGAAPGARVIPVEAQTLVAEPVTIAETLPGRTAAYRIAEVRPQVSGIIKKRLFVEGSLVKAGDLLYQIDPAVYQANFDSAKAALANARSAAVLAKLKADKYGALGRTNAVSKLEEAEYKAVWQQAQANVAMAQATLKRAEIDLDYTKVRAPISGRIGKSSVTEGALVTALQSMVMATIQQLNPIYVDVSQSTREMLRLKQSLSADAGQEVLTPKSKVAVMLEDGSEYMHPGFLEFSDVTVNPSTGSVTLRAVVENPDEDLLPGMFVRARISSGINPNGILIPAGSVSHNAKGQSLVMLVNADSKVEARVITVGENRGEKVLVESGLVAGETLITAGLQNIRAGSAVKIDGQKAPVIEAQSSQGAH
jgi:membrane fusion protein (multidrug efflux system)